MSLLMLLRRMGHEDLTVHGFRSTFRDWCAEATNYPRELAEQALAHTLTDIERAYRRGDLFAKRRRLMQDWASFCGQVAEFGQVVPIRA
jgi:integrase